MSTEGSKHEEKGGYRQINKALNICAFNDYIQTQASKLPDLPDVEQITPRVLRILGQNPGKFTYQGTNTFVVGTGASRILIDTSGGEPEYATLLASTLEARGIEIKHVLVTHWHGDHSGGVPDLVRMYPHLEEHIYKNDPERGQQDIIDGQTFQVEGATVSAVHSPGHSEDHMCFILREEGAMFTGDNILGHGTSAVENLGVYMSSLEKMLEKSCRTGYPAHGVTIDDLPAKIGRELTQKQRREKQAMSALYRLHAVGQPRVTVGNLVTGMYGDSIDETTRRLALEPFVDEILRKLAGDGKVGFERRSGGRRWYLVSDERYSKRMVGAKSPSLIRVQTREILDLDTAPFSAVP
jgi:glyoxylase-like metal-dependent hydrolase (beta-lactamase superfamily II)